MNDALSPLKSTLSRFWNLFFRRKTRIGLLDEEWQEEDYDSSDILLQLDCRKKLETLSTKKRTLLCVEILFREIEQILAVVDDIAIRDKVETIRIQRLYQDLKSSESETEFERNLAKETASKTELNEFLDCIPDSHVNFMILISTVFECGGLSLAHDADPRPAMIAVASHLDFAIGGLSAYEVFDKQATEPIKEETRFVDSLLSS